MPIAARAKSRGRSPRLDFNVGAILRAHLAALVFLVWTGCIHDTYLDDPQDPCAGIDCSGLGTCAVAQDNTPTCLCDPGYVANGLSCILPGDTDTSLFDTDTWTDRQTFYVDNSCANDGDGTAETCAASNGDPGAWNTLGTARWCAGMAPGDTLEIRAGIGVYREGAYGTFNVNQDCSGLPDKHTIIQNYPGEDVILDGSRDISGVTTWADQGSGVYLCQGEAWACGGTFQFPFTLWYDMGAGEQRLNLVRSAQTCDSTVAPGQMRATTDNRICLHLWNDEDPNNATQIRIPDMGRAFSLVVDGTPDYLTIQRNPAGGSFTLRRYMGGIQSANDNVGITIQGLDIGWMAQSGIGNANPGLAETGFRVLSNQVHHCGRNGIYSGGDLSERAAIAGNHIYEINHAPLFEPCASGCLDADTIRGVGISIGSTANAVIRDNRIHDLGGVHSGGPAAIEIWGGATHTLIDSNLIYNVNTPAISEGELGRGIFLDVFGEYPQGTLAGLAIRNNRLHNVDSCITFDTNVDLPASEQIEIVHNTCNEPAHSGVYRVIHSGSLQAQVILAGNIWRAVSTIPQAFLIDVHGPGFSPPEHSVFHCPACTELVQWNENAGPADIYDAATISSFGTGNQTGDPRIEASGSPPTLRLLAPGGSAYDRGSASHCPPVDFEDDPRPQSTRCDIGADELAH